MVKIALIAKHVAEMEKTKNMSNDGAETHVMA